MERKILSDFDKKALRRYSNNPDVLKTAEQMLEIGATSDYIGAIDMGFRQHKVPTVVFPLPPAEVSSDEYSNSMWDDNLNPVF